MTFHIDSIDVTIKFKHDDGGDNEARQYIQVNGVFPSDTLDEILISEFHGLYKVAGQEARRPCPYNIEDGA